MLSPADSPRAWRAVRASWPHGEGNCFLAIGESGLELSATTGGLYMAGGFVYRFMPNGLAQVAPCRYLGYTAHASSNEVAAFWNFGELLVFVGLDEVRYTDHLFEEDLEVREVSRRGLVVQGRVKWHDSHSSVQIGFEAIPRIDVTLITLVNGN